MLKRSGRSLSSILFTLAKQLNQAFYRIIIALLLIVMISAKPANAQLPSNVLVGYLENWNNLRMSQADSRYNVFCLAFAYDPPTWTLGYDLQFTRPPGYATDAAMMTDIDLMHSQGKRVLLSIGGASGLIRLNSIAERDVFITSVNNIFTRFGNKIDGLDLDLEGASMAFGTTWTITAPAPGQTYMIDAIKSIMATYLATNSKKMILTAAPEVLYLMGGMSAFQVASYNGGAFLPILEGLRNEIDLLFMQLYNAGGASGGVYAWDGNLYYDNGTPDFALAMCESVIKGFTCVSGKGTWNPFPESKIAFGLPATSAASTAGTGYLTNSEVCDAVRYFKGLIPKPGSITYTMNAFRPGMKGLMTWSINEDNASINGQWNFATNFNASCGLSATAPVSLLYFNAERSNEQVLLDWTTSSETNNDYFAIEYSTDGILFSEIAKVAGLGNSSIGQHYDYADYNTVEGDCYYRLAQYDFDGTVHYSEIKTVTNSFESGLHLNRNPFVNTLSVVPYGHEGVEASIRVTDCSGKLLLSKVVKGTEEIRIGESFVPGLYLLQFSCQGQTKQYKIIKQ
jgi:chitinase